MDGISYRRRAREEVLEVREGTKSCEEDSKRYSYQVMDLGPSKWEDDIGCGWSCDLYS